MTNEVQTAVTVAVSDALLTDTVGKPWYTSKTFWVNMIAASALVLQMKYGFVIDSSMQALSLTIVNVVLRKLTKEPITF